MHLCEYRVVTFCLISFEASAKKLKPSDTGCLKNTKTRKEMQSHKSFVGSSTQFSFLMLHPSRVAYISLY